MVDYYKILGVNRDADRSTIRQAYLDAARKWHPDSFSGETPAEAESQIRKLNEAWDVLRDEQRRKEHDRQISPVETVDSVQKIKIDSKFVETDYINTLRRVQEEKSSEKQIRFGGIFALIAVILLVAAVMVVLVYATERETSPSPTTIDLNIGRGINIGDCVSIVQGPALIERPCDELATGRVVSAFPTDLPVPCEESRLVELRNAMSVCLANP